MPEPGDSIELFASYKGWTASKKIPISGGTTPAAVVKELCSMRSEIDRKAFEILGIDTSALDAYAKRICPGRERSITALAELYRMLGSRDATDAVAKSCNGKQELEKVASSYLLRCVTADLGFDICIDPKMVK